MKVVIMLARPYMYIINGCCPSCSSLLVMMYLSFITSTDMTLNSTSHITNKADSLLADQQTEYYGLLLLDILFNLIKTFDVLPLG